MALQVQLHPPAHEAYAGSGFAHALHCAVVLVTQAVVAERPGAHVLHAAHALFCVAVHAARYCPLGHAPVSHARHCTPSVQNPASHTHSQPLLKLAWAGGASAHETHSAHPVVAETCTRCPPLHVMVLQSSHV